MKKNILFVLLLLFIPFAQAEPAVVSYYGYVTFDSVTRSNALVTVIDSSGSTVASATSNQDAQYRVIVPLDGVIGQSLTFKVNGTIATTRTIDPDGSSIRFDLSASSSSSSGSSSGSSRSSTGGGGGGGSTGESFANIQGRESKDLTIVVGVPAKYSFTIASSPVSEIVITSNINAGLINSQIEVLKNRSSLINENAPGITYKYLNIWVGTSGFSTSKNIKEATIKFKVETSWITSNNFKDNNIALMRWDGTKWSPLETLMKTKDGTFTYFEAKTNAFSPFAITAGAQEETVSQTPQISAIKTPVSQQPVTPTPVATKSTPGFELVFVLATILTAFMLRRKNGL